jgi:uncharacterized caspase-like protein
MERGMRVSPASRAAGRAALCVGVSQYNSSPLQNSANDATDVAEALRGAGFRTQLLLEPDNRQLHEAVEEFAASLRPGGTAVFFFAGHGCQARKFAEQSVSPTQPLTRVPRSQAEDGTNYLIPVEEVEKDSARPGWSQLERSSSSFTPSFPAYLKRCALSAADVLAAMEKGRCYLNLIMLDACRNTSSRMARSSRSTPRGFTEMKPPVGSVLAFACAPGKTAADGSGRNGVFTARPHCASREPSARLTPGWRALSAERAAEIPHNARPGCRQNAARRGQGRLRGDAAGAGPVPQP